MNDSAVKLPDHHDNQILSDEAESIRESLIYVVDDEPVMTKLMVHHFSRAGFQNVKQLNDGVETVETLQASPPDLLILDLVMPDVSGRFLMQMIESDENYRTVPVIVISGAVESDAAADSLQLGAIDFLPKPVNAKTLLSRSVLALNNKRKLEGLQEQTDDALAAMRELRTRACRRTEKLLRDTLRN